MHAPKVSRHDLESKTHLVEQGTFAVDRYEQGDGWLYLARPLVDHPRLLYMEAYLLPTLGLQINRWPRQPNSTQAWYDFYIDVMAFEVGETCWTSRDLHLDVIVTEGKAARILDTDEFLGARAEGLLTAAEAEFALMTAHNLLNGLGSCGYSLRAWLRSAAGLEVAF